MDKLADPKKPSSQLPPRILFMTLVQATWLVDKCELIKYDTKSKEFDQYFEKFMMGPSSNRNVICLTCWQSLEKNKSAQKKHRDAKCLFVDRSSLTLTSKAQWFMALSQANLLKSEDIKVKRNGKEILETIFFMPKFFPEGDPEPIDKRRVQQIPKSAQWDMRRSFEKFQNSEDYRVVQKARGLEKMQGHFLDDLELRHIVREFAHKESREESIKMTDATMKKLQENLKKETHLKMQAFARETYQVVEDELNEQTQIMKEKEAEEEKNFEAFANEYQENNVEFFHELFGTKCKLESEIGKIDKEAVENMLRELEDEKGIEISRASTSMFESAEENPIREYVEHQLPPGMKEFEPSFELGKKDDFDYY